MSVTIIELFLLWHNIGDRGQKWGEWAKIYSCGRIYGLGFHIEIVIQKLNIECPQNSEEISIILKAMGKVNISWWIFSCDEIGPVS